MRKQYAVGQYSVDTNDSWASIEPRTYTADGTITGCLSAHGHGGVAIILHYPYHFLGDAGQAVARSGRCVKMGDYQDDAWGNDNAVLTMKQSYNWLIGQLGAKTGELYLMGTSMGFLSVCNFARWVLSGAQISGVDPPDVEIKAIAGLVPATSLDGIHDRDYNGYASEIETAYGGLSAYNSALATHDPTAYATELLSTPLHLWRSSNDPATTPDEVDNFAELAGAEVTNLGAQGHAYTGMELLEIVDFFDANA